jgi:probable rRNA maturation factor
LKIEILVDCRRWSRQRGAQALLRRAVAEAARALATGTGQLAIVLTDDSNIRSLNRQWRRKNAPTNVLSFPAAYRSRHFPLTQNRRRAGKRDRRSVAAAQVAGVGHGKTAGVPLLGDIVIAYETTKREARAERKPFAHHLAHLAVHGFLHLAGYDHATDRQAQAMEKLEAAILSRLDVPDPYTGTSAAT